MNMMEYQHDDHQLQRDRDQLIDVLDDECELNLMNKQLRLKRLANKIMKFSPCTPCCLPPMSNVLRNCLSVIPYK